MRRVLSLTGVFLIFISLLVLTFITLETLGRSGIRDNVIKILTKPQVSHLEILQDDVAFRAGLLNDMLLKQDNPAEVADLIVNVKDKYLLYSQLSAKDINMANIVRLINQLQEEIEFLKDNTHE